MPSEFLAPPHGKPAPGKRVKQAFVSRILFIPPRRSGTGRTIIYLTERARKPPGPCRSIARLLPGRIPSRFRGKEPDRLPVCPVLSCTTWGLSCLPGYPGSGELLPRLFTLTRPAEAERAVCFLRHFPSPDHYSQAPRLSPGMLSCGVRTFLPPPRERAIISGLFHPDDKRAPPKML